MGKYKKKSKFGKVIKIIGIILFGIIAIIVGLTIYSSETATNSQIKPLDYQVDSSNTIVINQSYKYTNDDLLLAVRDIDPGANEILYSEVVNRKLGGYHIIYKSGNDEGNVQLTVLVSELNSKVHMISLFFIENEANRKIYLRNNCDLTAFELAATTAGSDAITGFQILNDSDYFNSSHPGEFMINFKWSSNSLNDVHSKVTIVRGVIKNKDQWHQGLVNWWLQQKEWIRRDLNLDI